MSVKPARPFLYVLIAYSNRPLDFINKLSTNRILYNRNNNVTFNVVSNGHDDIKHIFIKVCKYPNKISPSRTYTTSSSSLPCSGAVLPWMNVRRSLGHVKVWRNCSPPLCVWSAAVARERDRERARETGAKTLKHTHFPLTFTRKQTHSITHRLRGERNVSQQPSGAGKQRHFVNIEQKWRRGGFFSLSQREFRPELHINLHLFSLFPLKTHSFMNHLDPIQRPKGQANKGRWSAGIPFLRCKKSRVLVLLY